MQPDGLLEPPELENQEIEKMKEHLTDRGESYDQQFRRGGYIVELRTGTGTVEFEPLDGKERFAYSSWDGLRSDLETYGVI